MDNIKLFEHQKEALKKLHNGCVLCGGTGSGKSITGLAYYMTKVCGGTYTKDDVYIPPKQTRPLYIITIAKKRDDKEWDKEIKRWGLSRQTTESYLETPVVVDSWNNIKKYDKVYGAMFIFDEQHVVGYGSWVKSFLRITRKNKWILLSATPGDEWKDYIALFIANGFYKTKTEFAYKHIVYSPYVKYAKIQYYIRTAILEEHRKEILVIMKYDKPTTSHSLDLIVPYNADKLYKIVHDRWNIFENKPIENCSELVTLQRRVINSDPGRLEAVQELCKKKTRVIIFYNYVFEKDMLKQMCKDNNFIFAEWNGQKHERIPDTDEWIYLVQYTSAAEAWECITTDTIIFYSLNYSYKIMQQSCGRVDRINTPYLDLYYYYVRSLSDLDQKIMKALNRKEDFNIKAYEEELENEQEGEAAWP